MSFNKDAQIYVSGLGAWFRVAEQNDTQVRLIDSDGASEWNSKASIEALMQQSEPSLTTDGDIQW